jgi:small subunit ribosomal protein S4
MGFASTRSEARQLVSHKAISVNGGTVSIAAYQGNAGDGVAVREKSQKQLRIQAALQIKAQVGFAEWVEVDEKKFSGILKQIPDREDILPDINENLVVELYSK